jgi:hypothetical protein
MKFRFRTRISGVASVSDQFETKKLNSKLEALNPKQIQNLKPKTKAIEFFV